MYVICVGVDQMICLLMLEQENKKFNGVILAQKQCNELRGKDILFIYTTCIFFLYIFLF